MISYQDMQILFGSIMAMDINYLNSRPVIYMDKLLDLLAIMTDKEIYIERSTLEGGKIIGFSIKEIINEPKEEHTP